MDYGKVFGLPANVKTWIEALQLPDNLSQKLEDLGYTCLLACAYLEEADLDLLEIQKPGHRRTLMAGALHLRSALERVKTAIVSTESLPAVTSPPIRTKEEPSKRTPIVNSAVPPRVASDYWARAMEITRIKSGPSKKEKINIMLVRHAQSLANVDLKMYTTHSDYSIPLSEEGTRQAADAGKRIASHFRQKLGLSKDSLPPHDWKCRIWTSPYLRTRQTSNILLENASGWITDIEESIFLVEQNFGLFEGVDWFSGELDERYPDELHHYQKAAMFGGRYWAKVPLGESRFDVCLRVNQIFDSIYKDAHQSGIQEFVVVSHGITLRAFAMMWLGLKPEWFEEEPNPKNASIRIINNGLDHGYIWPRQCNDEHIPSLALPTTSNPSSVLPSQSFAEDDALLNSSRSIQIEQIGVNPPAPLTKTSSRLQAEPFISDDDALLRTSGTFPTKN